jgi:hypothetical protein
MFGGEKDLKKEGNPNIGGRTDKTLLGCRQNMEHNEKTGQKRKETNTGE